MRKWLMVIAAMALTMTANAQTTSIKGTDGKLELKVEVKDGKCTYDLTYDGMRMLEESPLGFVASCGDFADGLSYVTSSTSTRHDEYSLATIKTSKVSKESNVLDVTLRNNQGRDFHVVFCLSQNDVAFRYEIPALKDKTYEEKRSIRIMKETTGFRLPEGTTTFLTPQSHAMIGWKGTKPSYEEGYGYDEPMDKKSGYGHGYTFPCLFHVAGDGWLLVSETGVSSRYCASHLSDCTEGGLYTVAFPMAEENNGNGTIEPAMPLPGVTPWRTITMGKSLKPIVETTVPWDYVEPLYEASKTYEYGKSTWSWIVWQDPSINYDDQVKFIDLAAAMGYDMILIDAAWDLNIGREGIKKLVEYGRQKNVGIQLWYSSSGYWNDIQQSPVNVMDNTIARKKEMKWMKSLGIRGIKVDFFGGDKQETMRLYEDILSDANDCGLTVIFHGCTLPRGWERMYPNYSGSEAVLASENIFFSQYSCDIEATITALHPFCRNTVGCMEFGGSFLNRRIGKGNNRGNYRRTTDCHELAQAVLFQNPIQNFAITPENLLPVSEGGAPEVALEFMKQVPTQWDETVFIDGYPAKYCVIARRAGSKWYIAGNNASGANIPLTLDLPMLKKGSVVTLYSDNKKDLEPQRTELKIKNPQAVKLNVAHQGGFVIVAE